ncbi:MAG TPA: EamA/RhaT family transporter, partial [Alphaproteobacteria bacterium]|nr:EamA/RhaT family transporter [Alphaproteobacteria bacterium]
SEIQLVTQIFSLVFSVIILLVFADPLPITGSADWLKFLMVGICGGIGVLCLVTSYRLVEPGQIAPFEYLGIPISFILGYIFFSEAPFDQLIPGVFLIIGAGLIIVWRERH